MLFKVSIQKLRVITINNILIPHLCNYLINIVNMNSEKMDEKEERFGSKLINFCCRNLKYAQKHNSKTSVHQINSSSSNKITLDYK